MKKVRILARTTFTETYHDEKSLGELKIMQGRVYSHVLLTTEARIVHL